MRQTISYRWSFVILAISVISFLLTGCESHTDLYSEEIEYDHLKATVSAEGGSEVFKVVASEACDYYIFQAVTYSDTVKYTEDIIYQGEEPPKWIEKMEINPDDGTLTIALKENRNVKSRGITITVQAKDSDIKDLRYRTDLEVWQEGIRPNN